MDVTQLLLEALELGASDVYLSELDGVSIRKDGQVILLNKGVPWQLEIGWKAYCPQPVG